MSEGNLACIKPEGERRSKDEMKMEDNRINANRRTVLGKKVKALRREGILPAVIYGGNQKPLPISLNRREATRMLIRLTPSSLITIDVDGEEHLVLLKETQRDYIRQVLLHADFIAVSRGEKIKTDVMVELVGEAPAVIDFNLIVMH
jgi:large subunit ribosomal protein L25